MGSNRVCAVEARVDVFYLKLWEVIEDCLECDAILVINGEEEVDT